MRAPNFRLQSCWAGRSVLAELHLRLVWFHFHSQYIHCHQLRIFAKYIQVNNLTKHLKAKQWEAFAKGYNGPGYKANRYHEKLEKAYKKYNLAG